MAYTLVDVRLSRSPDGPAEAVVRNDDTREETVYPIIRPHAVRLMRRIEYHQGETACVVDVVPFPGGTYLLSLDFVPNKQEDFA